MRARITHSIISWRACNRAIPAMASAKMGAIRSCEMFMGALLGLGGVGAASVTRAGRPPVNVARPVLAEAQEV